MSYKREDLILFDYDYLHEYQIKEEILDSRLSNLFEKLTFNYELGIIANNCLNIFLQ